jgi:hypothetical protein
MVLWEASTQKFSSPWRAASRMAAATAGVVVSNPTPRKSTRRERFALASATASSGE